MFDFSLGVWGRSHHSFILSADKSVRIWFSWRYDFLGIVDTISELAKAEQEESEVFRKRADNVRQPDTVRQE